MNGRLSSPIVVAFVSGKGGVGKTSLATNFAWMCAHTAPTILVDLDFPNQGATGLIAPRAPLDGVDALSALRDGAVRQAELMEIAPGLRFMPAVSWNSPDDGKRNVPTIVAKGFDGKLDRLLRSLTDGCEADIIVLDCHGGVDEVSAAAFKCSDLTLMVTEADSVTFAGTLELLTHYRSSLKAGVPVDKLRQGRRSLEPEIRFIVNRLPGKYRFEDLEQICYSAQLLELKRPDEFGAFSHDVGVLCYIPSEDMIAESFGEYPFQVEIAPTSVFARKIAFMVSSVFDQMGETSASSFPLVERMKRESYRKKVCRIVVSDDERNTRQIVGGFAWSATMAVGAGAVSLLCLLAISLAGIDNDALLSKLKPLVPSRSRRRSRRLGRDARLLYEGLGVTDALLHWAASLSEGAVQTTRATFVRLAAHIAP